MKFCELKKEEYDKFAQKHPLISSYQVSEWGKLKEITGWKYHLIGIKEKNNIIAATLLLEKQTPIKKSIFYAPRGFLIDFKNKKTLTFFTENIKKYIKNKNGFMLKIDPNYIYQIRDNDGKESEIKNDDIIKNLTNLNFKHFGFNYMFETMQPRFLCRFKIIDNNYEKTLNSFSKSTRKNIESTKYMGVKVRVAKDNEVTTFTDMMNKTAEKKHIVKRPNYYYEEMYKCLKKYSKIYISYIDTKLYLNNVLEAIEEEKKKHQQIVDKMKKEKVGKNLKHQLEISNQRSLKLIKEKKYAQELNKKAKIINIGALYAIYINDEGITFMSGIDDDYRKFNPKYAMYNKHIEETIKQKMNYVNFYGIAGIFDKSNPEYKIYELKKGFNTEVIELIGEFDLIINKFYYNLYKAAMKVYKLSKKIKK